MLAAAHAAARNRSDSPLFHRLPDPEFMCCCGKVHVATASRVLAIYLFVLCFLVSVLTYLWYGFERTYLSGFCALATLFCMVLLYGVFLEKRLCLLPFLFIQTLVCCLLFLFTFAFAVIGAATDVIPEHHRDYAPIRDLYEMHRLDPDSETAQTVVSVGLFLFMLANCFINALAWWLVFRTWHYYSEKANGYMRGQIRAIDTQEELEKK